jgi:hypothetical protein
MFPHPLGNARGYAGRMDEGRAVGGEQAAPFTELPIAWAPTGDGEVPYRAVIADAELRVRVNDFPAEPLYSLLVDGRHHQDLDDWPAAWTRPGAPVRYLAPSRLRQAAAAQARRGRVDAIVAAGWAAALCELPRSPAVAAVAALGLDGTLTEAAGGRRLEPPPPGTTRFQVAEPGGDVAHVELTVAVPTAGRADFDALLGAGTDVPRVHYDQPFPVCYRVTVAGAPYTCDVFAYFDRPPGDGGPAHSLLLRRQAA